MKLNINFHNVEFYVPIYGDHNPRKQVCSRCNGVGAYWTGIRNGSQINNHYVSCDMPGCHNGMVDRKENYLALRGCL